MVAAPTPLATADDLARLGPDVRAGVIGGVIVEKAAQGGDHGNAPLRTAWFPVGVAGLLALFLAACQGTATSTDGLGGGMTTTDGSGGMTTTDGSGGMTTTPCVPFDDGNACTEDACADGSTSHTDKPAGAPCDGGTGTCDGAGHCVHCTSDDQCPGGTCSGGACVCTGTFGLRSPPLLTFGTISMGLLPFYNLVDQPSLHDDFNGDGHVDLVTTFNDVVQVWLGHGDGTFSQTSYPVGLDPAFLNLRAVSGDLDHDGDLDILTNALTVGGPKGRIGVFPNLGDGTFGPEIVLETDGIPFLAGDVTGDGSVDLVLVTFQSATWQGTLEVIVNPGDGTLGTPQILAAFDDQPSFQLTAATTLRVADLDHDSLGDIVYGSGVGEMHVVLHNPDGSLAPPVHYEEPRIFDLRTADVDGDGAQDLILNEPGVTLLRNRGDGTFSELLRSAAESTPHEGIAAADLDGDGLVDLATQDTSSDSLHILHNNGGGVFVAVDHLPVQDAESNWTLTAADFNADGRPDLACRSDEDIVVATNHEDGVFTLTQEIPLDRWVDALAAADLDGDGLSDIVAIDSDVPGLVVLLHQSDGSFAPPAMTDLVEQPLSIAAGDLDGDDRVDLVMGFRPAAVQVLLGQGNGTFEVAGNAPIGALGGDANGSWATIADFDGDGQIDIAALSLAVTQDSTLCSSELTVLRNQGDAVFSVTFQSELPCFYSFAGSRYSKLMTGDFNADGATDIVLGAAGVGAARILLNDGTGNFGPFLEYKVADVPTNMIAADVNADGATDLVAPEVSGDIVTALSVCQP